MNDQKEQGFEAWAIVEVMGHQTYAGRVTEEVIAGQAFVRVDVPATQDDQGKEHTAAYTKFVGPSSIYALTPVSEELARAAARRMAKTPISIYVPELHPPSPPAATRSLMGPDDDDFEDRFDRE